MSRRTSQLGALTLFASLVLSLLAAASAAPVSAYAGTPPTASDGSRQAQMTTAQFESRILTLLNARRKKVGCPTLRLNDPLKTAARRHSKLMAAAENLSHQLPREARLATRIERAGYTKWRGLAENIAWGSGTPARIFNMWANSAPHRANMDYCGYRDAGVGVVRGGGHSWVTLDLGKRR